MILTLTLVPVAPAEAVAVPAVSDIFPFDLGEPRYVSDDGVFRSWNEIGMVAAADIMVVEFHGQRTGSYDFILDSLGNHLIFGGSDVASGRVTEDDGKITLDFRGLSIGNSVGFALNNTEDWANVTRIYLDIMPRDEDLLASLSPKVIYVDADNSSDGNGTEVNPYRSIAGATNAANPGDVIIVADGIYHGVVTLPPGVDGRPTILKAAAGARPVITPTISLDADWSIHKAADDGLGNIYVADISNVTRSMNTEFPQFFVDGVSMIEARYPNLPGTDMSVVLEQEMLIAQQGTNLTNIVFPEALPFDPSGASVVLWPGDGAVTGWQADTARIDSVSGNIARFATLIDAQIDHVLFEGQDDKSPFPGNPFYLVGALSLLDAPGEYYFDASTGRLYFYAPNGSNPESLNLSLRSNERFAIITSSNTVIDGFDIYGGGIDARGRNITIQNCAIRYADHHNLRIGMFADWYGLAGIHGFNLYGINNTVRNCIIGPTAGSGIATGGIGNTITNNIIHDIAYSGQWFAGITAYGLNEHLEISHNSIHNSGRDLIYIFTYSMPGEPDDSFAGSVIRNNHFKNPMIFASDGGAIFMGGTDGGGTAEIHHNFVEVGDIPMHGIWEKAIHGIYFEGADNYIVRNNISIGEGSAMSMNFPHEGIHVFDNTVIGARKGFAMGGTVSTDGTINDYARNFILRDNLFVDILTFDVEYSLLISPWDVPVRANFDENGRFAFTFYERDGMIVTGNTRGTVDGQFRPTGDTPNVGAVLRGEEMFEYGATWGPGDVPYSDGIIPDYAYLNLGREEVSDLSEDVSDAPALPPETTPPSDSPLQDADPEDGGNTVLWVVLGTVGVAGVVVVVVLVVKKKK